MLDAIFRELQLLGFTEYEARAYVTLLKCQPATAYEVGKRSGLPRANVYAALDSLAKKMAAQVISQNPVRYVAAEPRDLLGRISRQTTQRCDSLAERLAVLACTEERDHVWTLHDEPSIHARIDELIEAADQILWFKGPANVVARHKEVLARSCQRGVRLELILLGAEAEQFDLGPAATIHLHEGTGLDVGTRSHLVVMMADFQVALSATLSADPHGIFTASRVMVEVVESLLRHELYLAAIFAELEPQIEELFGPALLTLRRKYLPKERSVELERLLAHRAANQDKPRKRRR